jgi:hypothetical protein
MWRKMQNTRNLVPRTMVNRLQRSVTRLLNDWRNDNRSSTVKSLDPKDHSPGGKAHSDSEKAEIRNHNVDTQFQLVTDLSVPVVIEMVDVALRSYIVTPANEPNLSDPDEVHEAKSTFKFSKAPRTNGFTNRALKHLPKRTVSLLVHILNEFLLTHHFQQEWSNHVHLFRAHHVVVCQSTPINRHVHSRVAHT